MRSTCKMISTGSAVCCLRWVAILLLSGWGLLDYLSGDSPSYAHATVQRREIEFIYQVRLSQIPQGAKELHVWIPLAKTGPEQEVLQRDVHTPGPYTIAEDPEYGNDMLHLKLQTPVTGHLEVQVNYRVRLGGGDE